jgi:hypothetical protein
MAGLQRFMLWVGAVGTLLLIAVGTVRTLASSGPPPLSVAFFLVVVAIWMLSPYWGVSYQQRRGPGAPAEAAVSLAALVLVVSLGAYAYLAGWVFYEGPTRTTGQGMLAVTLYQWVILGIASGLRWAVRRLHRHLHASLK